MRISKFILSYSHFATLLVSLVISFAFPSFPLNRVLRVHFPASSFSSSDFAFFLEESSLFFQASSAIFPLIASLMASKSNRSSQIQYRNRINGLLILVDSYVSSVLRLVCSLSPVSANKLVSYAPSIGLNTSNSLDSYLPKKSANFSYAHT